MGYVVVRQDTKSNKGASTIQHIEEVPQYCEGKEQAWLPADCQSGRGCQEGCEVYPRTGRKGKPEEGAVDEKETMT